MDIRPLDREEYAGYSFHVEYTTAWYYDVDIRENGFLLERRPFPAPERRSFSDTLFSKWLEDPVAFGAFEGKTLLGFIEGSPEAWHNVFRISNIYLSEACRGRGIGSALMTRMLAWARERTACRGVVLETQTCNDPAIRFYRKRGFHLSRIDVREYANDDAARKEVRIDLFLPLERT